MSETETALQELQSVSDSVAEYFCEDSTKFKLEECCSIFKSFCGKFIQAMQVSLLCIVLVTLLKKSLLDQ